MPAPWPQSVIPYYNSYFADTWHIKPTVTLSYGMSYQLEMPPYEMNAKQVTMVYQDGSPVVRRGLHCTAQESGAGRFRL